MPFLALLKLVTPREWALIAALLAFVAWSWHEQNVGDAKCEARVAKAQEQADAKAADLQKRLDARAAEDAGLQAVAVAVAPVYAPIKIGCSLTPAELAQIRDRLK